MTPRFCLLVGDASFYLHSVVMVASVLKSCARWSSAETRVELRDGARVVAAGQLAQMVGGGL